MTRGFCLATGQRPVLWCALLLKTHRHLTLSSEFPYIVETVNTPKTYSPRWRRASLSYAPSRYRIAGRVVMPANGPA